MDKADKSSSARLFWTVILGIILYVVLDMAVQLLPPHYSPISQAESDLAVGKFGFIMTINFLIRGVLSLLFIYAFLKTLDYAKVARPQFRTGTYLLGAWAVGAILLAIFPTDVPATPVSWHGAIHLIVAIIAFIGGAFGTLAISHKLSQNGKFPGLKRIALPLSIIVVVLLVVDLGLFFFVHLNSRIGGLTERLFLGSVLLWIAVVSAYLAIHMRQIKTEAPGKE
jgi:sensor histidine kinase YesM